MSLSTDHWKFEIKEATKHPPKYRIILLFIHVYLFIENSWCNRQICHCITQDSDFFSYNISVHFFFFLYVLSSYFNYNISLGNIYNKLTLHSNTAEAFTSVLTTTTYEFLCFWYVCLMYTDRTIRVSPVNKALIRCSLERVNMHSLTRQARETVFTIWTRNL